MDAGELNEVASLLHIATEISTNYPNLQAISRACQARLAEIESGLRDAEATAVEVSNKASAEKAAADYKAPQPGDPGYVEPEKAPAIDKPSASALPDPNANVDVERRV